MTLPPDHPFPRTSQSALVRAYQGQTPSHPPVWFMRQAGRSLPEYRAAREGLGMLESCLRPELAAKLTCQPVTRHGVDAAIFFSDIVVPLHLAGIDVTITPGVGPEFDNPIRSAADVAALPELDPVRCQVIAAGVREAVDRLGDTPLIAFAGAPFTLACYLVEGGPSRDKLRTRALMHTDRPAWDRLAAWAARTSAVFLRAQVEAGASALQVFDSWVGALSPDDYRELVAGHSAALLDAVADLGVPRVHFGLGTGEVLGELAAHADVVGVDHHVRLSDAIDRIGPGKAVQGNLDPALLFAPESVLHAAADRILAAGRAAPGHVFNLGHGVPPNADPEVLTRLVEHIHGVRTDTRTGE